MNLFTPLLLLLLSIIHLSIAQGSCSTSVSRANITAHGPVNINLDPLIPIDNNRLSALNDTIHQEWYFDSFSIDGTSDMAIVFFNQPGSPKGELFVMLDAIWSNGTRSSNTIFVEESQIITCPSQTTGT
jgi:hypothetical protein